MNSLLAHHENHHTHHHCCLHPHVHHHHHLHQVHPILNDVEQGSSDPDHVLHDWAVENPLHLQLPQLPLPSYVDDCDTPEMDGAEDHTIHGWNEGERVRVQVQVQVQEITWCMRWTSRSIWCSSGDFTRVMKTRWATWSWMRTRMWVMMQWQMQKVRRHGTERQIMMISRRTTIHSVGTGVRMG